MDLSKLSLGTKVVGAAGILLLIDSFLHWQEVNIAGIVSAGVSMWHGWGVLAGLTLLVILAWEAAQIADVKITVGPLSPAMVTIVLSALLVLFTLIKVLADDFVAKWAWIGLVLAIAVAVGAWLKMQAAGETLADLKASVASAAPRGDSAPAAPAAPAAPDAPVAPEPPEEPLDATH